MKVFDFLKVGMLLIIFVSFSNACILKNKSENHLIDYSHYSPVKIYLDSIDHLKNLMAIIERLEFIPLQTTDSNVIGSVDKIICFNNNFYILDKSFSSLKIFNHGGDYLGSVGGLGRGPGEFTDLQDFIIDSNKMQIDVLSNDIRMINRYDLSGHYIDYEKNNILASNFGVIKNIHYYYVNNNISDYSKNYNLILTDSLGNVINRLFKIPKDMRMSFEFTGTILPNINGLLYSNPLSDTIFQVTPAVMYPKYIFSFGSASLPDNDRISLNEFFRNGRKYSFLENKIIESDRILSFSYQDKGKIAFAFFDKIKKGLLYKSNIAMKNDILSKILEVPIGLKANKYFISIIRPSKLIGLVNKNDIQVDSLKKYYPFISNLLSKLTESDNPIIAIFDLKKDQ